MDLVSMKNEKKPDKNKAVEAPTVDGDEYPYGLRITLNHDQLKKLDMSDVVDEYDIDDVVTIEAKCKVKRVEKSKGGYTGGTDDKDKENQALELQITDIALDKGEEEEAEKDKLDWDSPKGMTDKVLKEKGF